MLFALGPSRVVVIGDTSDGQRCVATCTDIDLAAQCTEAELVGTTIQVRNGSFTAR